MHGRDKAPLLLTPGPITMAEETRAAMLRDWGSRDGAFIELTARVRARLTALAGGAGRHVCVPLQGSGTFAVEAALGTLAPRDGKLLVLANGAYGRRMARICATIGRAAELYETAEDTPPDPAEVARRLAADRGIAAVAMVHCETTSGILNPVAEVAAVAAAAGRPLILDTISAVGALPVDVRALPCAAAVGSPNKCLEGAPGVAFVIVETDLLAARAGAAHSLVLDLHDQWQALEGNGQWRFTPPTHVLAALDRALEAHAAEGGAPARLARYRANCRALVDGMRGLGLETYLPDALQAPIIVTFHAPADPNFSFPRFYALLAEEGYLIYPGKVTRAETFRVGCIGHVTPDDMAGAVAAAARALERMGVRNRGRKAA